LYVLYLISDIIQQIQSPFILVQRNLCGHVIYTKYSES